MKLKRLIALAAALILGFAVLPRASFAETTPLPGSEEAYELFLAAMAERGELATRTGIPDYFGGAWIDENDGKLHINFYHIDSEEYGFYEDLLSPYQGRVVFGEAEFSKNKLIDVLESVLSELLKAGVTYSYYDIHDPTQTIRITVPGEGFEKAERMVPELDCVRNSGGVRVMLSRDGLVDPSAGPTPVPDGNEGEGETRESGFPILAVLFGAAAVVIFFLRRKSEKDRITRMRFMR